MSVRSVRISDDDWSEICARAEDAGISTSEFIRTAALGDGARIKARVRRLEGLLDELGPQLINAARIAALARGK